MSVTAVDRLYALPDQGGALAENLLVLTEQLGAATSERPPGVFRGHLDPDALLCVADWDSREVHRAWADLRLAALDSLVATAPDV